MHPLPLPATPPHRVQHQRQAILSVGFVAGILPQIYIESWNMQWIISGKLDSVEEDLPLSRIFSETLLFRSPTF